MRKIVLPDEERLPEHGFNGPREGTSKYKPILKEIGLSNPSKREVDALREAVGHKVCEIGDKYAAQNMLDLMSGKLKRIEDAKLFRRENEDGTVTITNIPDDYFKWVFFMTWLNELSRSMGDTI